MRTIEHFDDADADDNDDDPYKPIIFMSFFCCAILLVGVIMRITQIKVDGYNNFSSLLFLAAFCGFIITAIAATGIAIREESDWKLRFIISCAIPVIILGIIFFIESITKGEGKEYKFIKLKYLIGGCIFILIISAITGFIINNDTTDDDKKHWFKDKSANEQAGIAIGIAVCVLIIVVIVIQFLKKMEFFK